MCSLGMSENKNIDVRFENFKRKHCKRPFKSLRECLSMMHFTLII